MNNLVKDENLDFLFNKTKAMIKNKNYKKALWLIKTNPDIALIYNENNFLEPNLLALAITHHMPKLIEPLLNAQSIMPFICIEQLLVNTYFDKHFFEEKQRGNYFKINEEICHLFLDLLNNEDLERIKSDIEMARGNLEVIAKTAPFIHQHIDAILEKKLLDSSIESNCYKNKVKL
jgi:hypothetical protein